MTMPSISSAPMVSVAVVSRPEPQSLFPRILSPPEAAGARPRPCAATSGRRPPGIGDGGEHPVDELLAELLVHVLDHRALRERAELLLLLARGDVDGEALLVADALDIGAVGGDLVGVGDRRVEPPGLHDDLLLARRQALVEGLVDGDDGHRVDVLGGREELLRRPCRSRTRCHGVLLAVDHALLEDMTSSEKRIGGAAAPGLCMKRM